MTLTESYILRHFRTQS